VYSALEKLETIRNIEIGSLHTIIDEQMRTLNSLKEERQAFERHRLLLESQNS
jgi:hypothetical protein